MTDNYKQLMQEYRRLAKRADQRLVSIEKLSKTKEYKGIQHFAYERAMRDIKTYGAGKRFNTTPPESTQGLKAKIADIKNFLSMKTSTKSGIDKYYKERQKTLAQRFGVSNDWHDLLGYYRSGLNETLDKRYGYYTSLRVVGIIQKNKKEIRQAIKEAKAKDIMIGDALDGIEGASGVIKEAIEDALSNYIPQLRRAKLL